jgi:nitrile hydratase
MDGTSKSAGQPSGIVFALGEKAIFKAGDRVRVSTRSPIGHYRVPTYLRGKIGSVEKVIEPAAIDNEEEGMAAMPGRNATTIASRFG